MVARRRVTIRDVARAAGVSKTTASDALNGKGRLPAETRSKVSAAAAALGYSANPRSRQFRHGRSGTLGLYFPDGVTGLEYYMTFALGAAEMALRHDLALILIPAWRDPRRVASVPIDGLIVVDAILGDPVFDRLGDLHIPLVSCERDLTPGNSYAAVVENDTPQIMRNLLRHLAGQGARRIALIGPGTDTAWGLDMRRTYLRWCAEHAVEPLLREVPFVVTPEDIARAADSLLAAEGAPPDALISANDGGAIGAMHAAQQRGLRVPDDILIAAFTDSTPLRSCIPAITAVDLQPRAAGRRCAELLTGFIEHPDTTPVTVTVPGILMERASTVPGGPARRSHAQPRATM